MSKGRRAWRESDAASGADALLPRISGARANVLSFLNARDTVVASEISDAWFRAAAEWPAWRQKFACEPRLAEIVALGPDAGSFNFPAPAMYAGVLQVLRHDGSTVEKVLVESEFYSHVGGVIGRASERYTTVFPALHFFVRHPAIHRMPIDKPVRSGYITAPRYVLLIANVARMHFTDPREPDVPWLLATYAWAVGAPVPYHKVMLASAVYLLTSPRAAELLSNDDVDFMLRTTQLLVDRYLPVTGGAAPSPPPEPPLPDDEPRGIFSVYYYIQKALPQMRRAVDVHVLDCHGERGRAEVLAAAARVEFMLAAEGKAHSEKLRRIGASIAHFRSEPQTGAASKAKR